MRYVPPLHYNGFCPSNLPYYSRMFDMVHPASFRGSVKSLLHYTPAPFESTSLVRTFVRCCIGSPKYHSINQHTHARSWCACACTVRSPLPARQHHTFFQRLCCRTSWEYSCKGPRQGSTCQLHYYGTVPCQPQPYLALALCSSLLWAFAALGMRHSFWRRTSCHGPPWVFAG